VRDIKKIRQGGVDVCYLPPKVRGGERGGTIIGNPCGGGGGGM
jgi:hypothetical protein